MTVQRTMIGQQAQFVPFRPSTAIPKSDVQTAIEYVRSMAVANAVSLTESNTAPSSPTAGMLWWSPAIEILHCYITSVGWLDISTAGFGGGGAKITSAAAQPSSPNDGDFWWDTASETLNIYIAAITNWLDLSSAGGSTGIAYTEGVAPPASPNLGDQWWDTITEALHVYTSNGWINH